jgi:hypothetical protein
MGIIYKITSNKGVYYGSTTLNLKRREQLHLKDLKAFLDGKRKEKCSCFEILQDEYVCEMVEEVDDNLIKERERYYIENFECVNINIPNRTKDEMKKQVKDWNETHKEYIKEKAHERYLKNKDIIQENHKNYYIKNFEKMRVKSKQYFETHKLELFKPVICECGSTTSLHHKKRHEKSKVHLYWVSQHSIRLQ